MEINKKRSQFIPIIINHDEIAYSLNSMSKIPHLGFKSQVKQRN